jgi:hypothetical protein
MFEQKDFKEVCDDKDKGGKIEEQTKHQGENKKMSQNKHKEKIERVEKNKFDKIQEEIKPIKHSKEKPPVVRKQKSNGVPDKEEKEESEGEKNIDTGLKKEKRGRTQTDIIKNIGDKRNKVEEERPKRMYKPSKALKDYVLNTDNDNITVEHSPIKKSEQPKKRLLKNNYVGIDELGVVTDSNKFPVDEFYGSSAEKLFIDIQENVDYISKENIKLSVKEQWIPILKIIQSMLNIIVGEVHFTDQMTELQKLHEKIKSLLPRHPILSTAPKPPHTVDHILQEQQKNGVGQQKKETVITILDDLSKCIEVCKDKQLKQINQIKNLYEYQNGKKLMTVENNQNQKKIYTNPYYLIIFSFNITNEF